MKIRAIAIILALLAIMLLAGCEREWSKAPNWGPFSGAR